MNYTPEEIGELLKETPHQAHYIAAMVRKAVAAERERCAKLVTTGDYCRHVDHNNGTCDCADLAAAIRAA